MHGFFFKFLAMFYALEFFLNFTSKVFLNDNFISLITSCAKFVLILSLDILIWNMIIQILVIPRLIFYHSFIVCKYVHICFVFPRVTR